MDVNIRKITGNWDDGAVQQIVAVNSGDQCMQAGGQVQALNWDVGVAALKQHEPAKQFVDAAPMFWESVSDLEEAKEDSKKFYRKESQLEHGRRLESVRKKRLTKREREQRKTLKVSEENECGCFLNANLEMKEKLEVPEPGPRRAPN